MKTPYEGENCPDGEYQLGQLSKGGYGRVVKDRDDIDKLLYETMPVSMDEDTFESLFRYVKERTGSIHDFIATVRGNIIVHVYEE